MVYKNTGKERKTEVRKGRAGERRELAPKWCVGCAPEMRLPPRRCQLTTCDVPDTNTSAKINVITACVKL